MTVGYPHFEGKLPPKRHSIIRDIIRLNNIRLNF
jgi:hypothetical protein